MINPNNLQKSIIILMPQLSSFSQTAINKIRIFLTLVQKLISEMRRIMFVKIPQLSANIAYSLSLLMDLSTFLPSYIYKVIAALIAFVFIRRKVKKYLCDSGQKQQVNKKEDETRVQPSEIFGNLGEEFEVQKKVVKTEACNSIDQQDSCCKDLSKQLQNQPREFRDVFFFQAMDSYCRALKKEAKEVPKHQRK